MNELQKPSPELAALSREWQRQFESGELTAGYWQWYVIDGAYKNSVAYPNWPKAYDYEYAPRLNHPHYAVYKEWEAHKAGGEVGKNWWCLLEKLGGGSAVLCANYPTAGDVPWTVSCDYEIIKTSKHPDNQKPKLKLIDYGNAPVGTMTNLGEIRAIARRFGVWMGFIEDVGGDSLDWQVCDHLRIVPATRWTAIQDGESSPVCEGLVIEYRSISRNFQLTNGVSPNAITKNPEEVGINAYRVIGLAEGYTDDTAKVTA